MIVGRLADDGEHDSHTLGVPPGFRPGPAAWLVHRPWWLPLMCWRPCDLWAAGGGRSIRSPHLYGVRTP